MFIYIYIYDFLNPETYQARLPELAAIGEATTFGALYARRRLELIYLRCAPAPQAPVQPHCKGLPRIFGR